MLIARGLDPFKVLAKVWANACKLELHGDMDVSTTFNVGDLSPYVEDDIEFRDLKANPLKEREDDADQSLDQGSQPKHGKSLFTDHPYNQSCEGKQCNFDACLARSLLH